MKKYIIFLFNFIFLSTTCFIAGCSILSPVNMQSDTLYVLTSPYAPKYCVRKKPITLMVLPVDAASVYASTQMAYQLKPLQLAYFVKNRWADKPQKMLQGLITDALDNSNCFAAVVSPPLIVPNDYILQLEITKFLQNYTCQQMFNFELRAQLIRSDNNKIVATKKFVINIPIHHQSPYWGVYAADMATKQLLKRLVSFVSLHAKVYKS